MLAVREREESRGREGKERINKRGEWNLIDLAIYMG